MSTTKREAATALSQLHDWKVTGQGAPTISESVLRDLAHERLVEPDEAGAMSITERGEQHLSHLRRRHTAGSSLRGIGRRPSRSR